LSTINEIKKNKSKIYRTVEVKRRDAITGLFESEWQDISNDVKKWGTLKTEIDSVRLNKFKFGTLKMTFANDAGRFNDPDDPASFWFGYLPMQRTLLRIKTGFYNDVLEDGIYHREKFPVSSIWDDVDTVWDRGNSLWDSEATSQFKGIVSGDIFTSDKNETSFNIRPTLQLFRDYEARNLNAYDTSMTASKFMTMVRDHQDVNNNYIFRPFFDDTTASWLISSTTAIYPDLSTSTAENVINTNVWDVMNKLAEAENFVIYISKGGDFVFKDKDNITTTTYEFHGRNSVNTEYGHTIKKITSYGLKISKFYTRVQIRHNKLDTTTSYAISEATLTVSPASSAWLYGERTLKIENEWMDGTLAQSLATSIFDEVSSIKNEIKFSTSFVPQLDILDQATISYNSGTFNFANQWNLNNWGEAGSTVTAGDLIWNSADGDALDFNNKEFKLLSYELNLDSMESKFIAREV